MEEMEEVEATARFHAEHAQAGPRGHKLHCSDICLAEFSKERQVDAGKRHAEKCVRRTAGEKLRLTRWRQKNGASTEDFRQFHILTSVWTYVEEPTRCDTYDTGRVSFECLQNRGGLLFWRTSMLHA